MHLFSSVTHIRHCRRSIRKLAARSLMYLISIAVMGFSSTRADEAQPKARSFRDRVVDKVSLSDGTLFWGILVNKKPTRLMVSSKWIRSNAPKFFLKEIAPAAKNNSAPFQSLIEKLQEQIDRLQGSDGDNKLKTGLLREIQNRLTPDDQADPTHIILELPKSRIRNIESQPDNRRELCRLATLNGIEKIEDTHWKSIVTQLQAIPESSRRTAPPDPQQDADQQLQLILAAVDLRTNSASRMIQSGSSIIDETTSPDFGAILNSMLGGNVQSLLDDLLNEGQPATPQVQQDDKFPEAARRIADAKGHSTAILTGFEFDVGAGSATVVRHLYHKDSANTWLRQFSSRQTSTTAEVKPGQTELIENDPQIREISGLIAGSGLGGEQFANAIRMGAVVQNALNEVTLSFEATIQDIITTRNLHQLAEPMVIVIPESAIPER